MKLDCLYKNSVWNLMSLFLFAEVYVHVCTCMMDSMTHLKVL